MFKNWKSLLFGLVGIPLAACSAAGSGQNLTDNIWLLAELNGVSPLPGTSITADFSEDGTVAGSSGCNNYSTSYAVDGDQIEFGEQIASTMMACPEPVMEQERAYLDALSNSTRFEIVNDELVLYDAGDGELARFAAVDQSLAGTNWEVIAYNNGKEAVVSVINGTQITAAFDVDGQVAGSAGCNNYFASYETDGEGISIGPAGSTRMMCNEPAGIMEQEGQYLAALETAARYRIEGDTMEMRTADGAIVANFLRSAAP